MTVEPQSAGPTFARSALTVRARRTDVYIYIYIYIKNIYIYIYIYMTKIFRRCTISVGLAPLANYSENSDNSTDKGGSLRSPIIYIYFRPYVVHVPLTRNAQTSDRPVEVQWSI